ncbi:uroporphyrinogen-III synthase [Sphingomonas montana]|uniref:uroporphyrinogen-III synthase n=1 Tax=Sphingomonas montana TaxID=1843236 RepID=UPI00096D8762|nr:uroporphyrinogen-III synthase [Sphingomonas montana]
MKLLILRPRVGGDATAVRAGRLGFDPVVAPLFHYRSLPWSPPDPKTVDAVLLTSAAAVRLGGDGLARFRSLPVQAVGTATADAARLAGFTDITTSGKDADAALIQLAARGHRVILHLAGREHIAVERPSLSIQRIPVYAADAVDRLPDAAAAALADRAVVLLHSPRAATVFAGLVRTRTTVRIACFSSAVADAANAGWAGVAVATHPTDDALFAAARLLCDQELDGMLEPQ